MNLTDINRLSRPKQGVYHIPISSRYRLKPTDKYTINTKTTNEQDLRGGNKKQNFDQQQLIDISNRLSRKQILDKNSKKSTAIIDQESSGNKKQNYNQQQLIEISNRLSREQPRRGERAKSTTTTTTTTEGPNNSNNKNKTVPTKDLEQLNKRMSRPLNRTPKRERLTPATPTPMKMSELERSVDRLSTPKQVKERTVDRFVLIERGRQCRNNKNKPLTNKEITGLCERLADPKYARTRTPDTRRLLDRTFSPVNTYAWQGIAHNDIDWKVYAPHSMLVY